VLDLSEKTSLVETQIAGGFDGLAHQRLGAIREVTRHRAVHAASKSLLALFQARATAVNICFEAVEHIVFTAHNHCLIVLWLIVGIELDSLTYLIVPLFLPELA
jgi:hypothetical protein